MNSPKNESLKPGTRLGILGSGQLGRMFTQAAHKLGFEVVVYSPEKNSPAGQIADHEICAAYDNEDGLKKFATESEVVTFEFENIPAKTAEVILKSGVTVYPHPDVLFTFQNRLREKTFLKNLGIPLASFYEVNSRQELERGLSELGYPAILKTSNSGYDGKGQYKIQSHADIEMLPSSVFEQSLILEEYVPFVAEASIVAARSASGEFKSFGLIENSHKNHILDLSVYPSKYQAKLESKAVEIARSIFEKIQATGCMCVEFFITSDSRLLVNEIAPRTHNSGHLTIEACQSSQFEQHVRAVSGLTLGAVDFKSAAAMVNLLGDLWKNGEPNWHLIQNRPNVFLHLYGKAEAKPGRKMGHITAVAETPEKAAEMALQARNDIMPPG